MEAAAEGDEKAAAQPLIAPVAGLAEDGALIYFEPPRPAPSRDMLGQVVVLETEAGEVLVRRLHTGARRGVYDLESLTGETRCDVALRWAAHITAIVPRRRARRAPPGA